MNAHFILETGFKSGTAAMPDSVRFFKRQAFGGLSGQ
jgi:predicted porin